MMGMADATMTTTGPGWLDELGLLLRPAGAGIFTVSTGRQAQLQLQSSLYGVSRVDDVPAAWRAALASLPGARLAVLGIPSDCGAGLVRGASFGPQELRRALIEARPGFREWAASEGVVDVGDVSVNPHLLHDDMLSEEQKRACRAAMYPALSPEEAASLPVSPLSMAERVLDRVFDANPRIKVLVLGGDHSVAWPVVAALKRRRATALGIVQPDAHTDLLAERLGVRICFATWAYHANDLIGREGRLVQVGVRTSRYPRQHWESTLGVRQLWADEVATRGEAGTLDEIVRHLRERGVRQLYFSNDIDATDAVLAPSTGAPESGGLTPDLVCALLKRLGAEFDLVGADLVEVAPPIGSAEQSRQTIEVGVRYLLASFESLLGKRGP
jgi:arginase family enzyme